MLEALTSVLYRKDATANDILFCNNLISLEMEKITSNQGPSQSVVYYWSSNIGHYLMANRNDPLAFNFNLPFFAFNSVSKSIVNLSLV